MRLQSDTCVFVCLGCTERVCVKGEGERETMCTEIRGYLFSIRMFQVRQASDEETEVQNKRRRGKEDALLQLVC